MISPWFFTKARMVFLGLLLSPSIVAQTSVSVPLGDAKAWLALEYSSIPANQVSHANNALTLSINHSASPLIHQLTPPLQISQVQIKARVIGTLNLDANKQQGDKGNDDFSLRLGFVTAGDKRLSEWQKPFAAKWVKQLFALAPENSGIDNILFLNVPENAHLTGTNRQHPASDLLHEYMLSPANADGTIEINHTFAAPKDIVALWISSDGDDTQSQYQIIIESIVLKGP